MFTVGMDGMRFLGVHPSRPPEPIVEEPLMLAVQRQIVREQRRAAKRATSGDNDG